MDATELIQLMKVTRDDRIAGSQGNDILNGDVGNGIILGDSDNNQMSGDNGNDILTDCSGIFLNIIIVC
jgi:Ca2+-binding RTX toxin-like protein